MATLLSTKGYRNHGFNRQQDVFRVFLIPGIRLQISVALLHGISPGHYYDGSARGREASLLAAGITGWKNGLDGGNHSSSRRLRGRASL